MGREREGLGGWVGFEPFGGGEAELGIPFFAEAAREWLFEEFVGANAFCASERFGALADLPAVEVDGGEAGVFFEPDGI